MAGENASLRIRTSTSYNAALNQARMTFGRDKFHEEQQEAIDLFFEGKDVFVSLPTGYGKSIIFQAIPVIASALWKKPCTIFVVSPLMEDQVNYLNGLGPGLGLKAIALAGLVGRSHRTCNESLANIRTCMAHLRVSSLRIPGETYSSLPPSRHISSEWPSTRRTVLAIGMLSVHLLFSSPNIFWFLLHCTCQINLYFVAWMFIFCQTFMYPPQVKFVSANVFFKS